MKRFFKHGLVVLSVCSSVIFAASIAFAAVPSISITKPGYVNYILQGRSSNVEATISDSPTSRTFYWDNVSKGSMSLVSGTTYRGSWTPTASDYKKGTYSSGVWYKPADIKITASNSSGSTSSSRPAYVTFGPASAYTAVDNTWNGTYIDEATNTFFNVGTGTGPVADGVSGTYNCLAYSVGIYTSWQWPWVSVTNPTLAQVSSYMSGASGRTTGDFYTNGSTSYSAYNTKVIFYNGGHVARVSTYTSSGAPAKIMSKWGAAEVIQSANYNPFTSVYGSPVYYFH